MSAAGAGEIELNEVATEAGGQLAISKDGVFGPTFQGEGPSLGRRCFFLRLAGCNQHCVWCDTPYTWAFSDKLAAKHRDGIKYSVQEEVHKSSIEDVIDQLYSKMAPDELPSMLVISGGEPMLQQKRLIPLLSELAKRTWRIEIETAGTIGPMREVALTVDQFNVSVKLDNSGNPLMSRYQPYAINALRDTGRAVWKFVAASADDLAEIRHIVKEHGLAPVFIMPEGINTDDLRGHMRSLADLVLAEGWHLTTRLQIEIWGNKRGV